VTAAAIQVPAIQSCEVTPAAVAEARAPEPVSQELPAEPEASAVAVA